MCRLVISCRSVSLVFPLEWHSIEIDWVVLSTSLPRSFHNPSHPAGYPQICTPNLSALKMDRVKRCGGGKWEFCMWYVVYVRHHMLSKCSQKTAKRHSCYFIYKQWDKFLFNRQKKPLIEFIDYAQKESLSHQSQTISFCVENTVEM